MIKKFAVILLIYCLIVSSAQAITITSDIDTDIGDIAAGDSSEFTLTASDYEAANPSGITWIIKAVEGSNPGFTLDRRRGEEVKLSASSLVRPRGEGIFSLMVTAQDSRSAGTIIITGRVVNKPVFRTTGLATVQAGSERPYVQRLEFNSGIEPLELSASENFPEGLSFAEMDIQGRKYHVITGDTNQLGTFTFTLTAQNTVGSDSREFTLNVEPVKARIKAPKDFPKEYLVYTGQPFFIDLNGFSFIGTKPLTVDIDERSQSFGLAYDDARKTITGTIPEGTKNRRLNVRLQASNEYGQPSTASFTLNIQSKAAGFRLSPASQKLQVIAEDGREIQVLPIYAGRPFRTQIKNDAGTNPITWDYIIAGMNDTVNGKRIIQDFEGKFGGLLFSEDGTIEGTPEAEGSISFVAEASNPVGVSQSGVYEFVFGRSPSFDKEKTSQVIGLLGGRSTTINPADYLIPASSRRFTASFNVTGEFPPGMAFDGTNIRGIPMALAPEHLKRYYLTIIATNAFGTSRSRIVLDLQDVPRIGDIAETINAQEGTSFRVELPALAKKPYTWRLEYSGETVGDEIGDSGINWDSKSGIISGAGGKIIEGTYTVTAYLANDVGEDNRTFTIHVSPLGNQ